MENFWALFSIIVGAFPYVHSFPGILESCARFFKGTGSCFLLGSGGVEVALLEKKANMIVARVEELTETSVFLEEQPEVKERFSK